MVSKWLRMSSLVMKSLVMPFTLHRVAQRDEVEPAATSAPASHGSVFAAKLDQAVAGLVFQLGRKRPGADAGDVRLRDPDDILDRCRADTRADQRSTGGRIGRGDEWIGAMVDVEQRPLGPFEENVLSVVRGLPTKAGKCRPRTGSSRSA